jgi:hypothetical protein
MIDNNKHVDSNKHVEVTIIKTSTINGLPGRTLLLICYKFNFGYANPFHGKPWLTTAADIISIHANTLG